MQIARALMPILSAGPHSQNPSLFFFKQKTAYEIDRNNHKGHAGRTRRICRDVTSQRKPRPCRRPEQKPTSSLAVASPKMQEKRAHEWRHARFEIGGVANNVNVGKFG